VSPTPQPYQPVCLMINQDFGWQAAGWLTRVPTSLGTSWRQLVPKLVPKLVEILVNRPPNARMHLAILGFCTLPWLNFNHRCAPTHEPHYRPRLPRAGKVRA